MQGLILDTSCNRSYIILAQEGRPMAFLPLAGGEGLSKSLGLKIDQMLNDHPAFRADFVAVGTGPGSYTGIRVGAAIAKALSFGWQIPLFAFCSLKAFLPEQNGPFAVLIDARMGGVYCLQGEKTQDGVQFAEPALIKSAQDLCSHCLLVSPHPEELHKRGWSDRLILNADPDPYFISAECCQKACQNGQNPLAFLPLAYLSSPG